MTDKAALACKRSKQAFQSFVAQCLQYKLQGSCLVKENKSQGNITLNPITVTSKRMCGGIEIDCDFLRAEVLFVALKTDAKKNGVK